MSWIRNTAFKYLAFMEKSFINREGLDVFSAALLDKLQSFESSDHFQAGGITHTILPFEDI
jgi:hypothetical protein